MPLVDSVQFKNYRNFTDFEMKDLKRVNLIVGDSNVGKTGLLEGLVTLWGDAKQFKALPNTFRMNYGDLSSDIENYWNWFYPQRDESKVVKFQYSEESFPPKKSLYFSEQGRYLSYDDSHQVTPWGGYNQRFSDSLSGSNSKFKINILPIGIGQYERQVNLFNELSLKKNGKEGLVESLKVIEPRLNGLEYLKQPSSSVPMIYADVGLDYKIPTTQFGHGFTRSMEMLSNLVLSGSDIMIADEIENGIHYSALGSVWKAIIDYAVKNDVQVFATTHSRECIAAAHEAMESQENYELNVIRLQNRKGEVVAINHSEEDIKTAFDLSLPLR